KLLGRTLHSQHLALFGFWLWVLFAPWGGVRAGLPVPNWLGGVGDVARVLVLVPALAIAMSWYATWVRRVKEPDPLIRFFLVAAVSFLLGLLLDAITAESEANRVLLFTLYDQGVAQLKFHGLIGMALSGAIYYIAPRVAGVAWPSPSWIRAH